MASRNRGVATRLPGVRLPLVTLLAGEKLCRINNLNNYTPGIGKIVPRNVINLINLIYKRLTISEWPTKILTTPS